MPSALNDRRVAVSPRLRVNSSRRFADSPIRRFILAFACGSVAMCLLQGCSKPPPATSLDDDLTAAQALLAAGQQDEAEAAFLVLAKKADALLADRPDDAHLQYIYGCACTYTGDDRQAAAALAEATRLDPGNPRYVLAQATLALLQDQPDQAVNRVRHAMELGATDAPAWEQLGEAQLAGQHADEAQAGFQRAADLDPAQPRYQNRLGQALAAQGQTDQAADAYRKAVAIDAKYAPAYASLGQLEQARGNQQAALDAFDKLLALTPDDWHTLACAVQACQALGKIAERDAARRRLLALWNDGQIDAPAYCREQFTYDGEKVLVFEYFASPVQPGPRLGFADLLADGKTIHRQATLSFVSADAGFRLEDRADPQHIVTITAFPAEPPYEDLRQRVIDYWRQEVAAPTQPATTATATSPAGQDVP